MPRIPPFLILALFFAYPAYSLSVFESIDCGSSSTYTDENDIIWSGDDFMGNGDSKVVQSTNGVSKEMTTLRVFTTRKKNCYSFSVDKGDQFLVRASFYYGNYDKKSSPPSFDLQFDGNHWDSVDTSLDEVMVYEAIYVAKFDYVSVCVAQTKPNQFPFISAIEVRSLGSRMYSSIGSDYALFTKQRVAFGSATSIRFPDDNYDRVWVPGKAGTGITTVASDAILINTEIDDDPPESAVRNAITPTSTDSIDINLAYPTSSPATTFYYINLYFSEVTELSSTQRRSFYVYSNNKQAGSSPIEPTYGGLTEVILNQTVANSNTSISLLAAKDSDFPPLINALETFIISNPMTDGTNSDDVDGLGAIQKAFTKLDDWSDDPCLPFSYTWDWLNCSSATVPRVTALYLSGYNLSGFLPDFSSMDALVTIDLHNNNIIGEIPDFLGTLPNLRELNLANNAFTGAIPTSITKNTKLKLVVTGNPGLCASGKSCQTSPRSGSDDSPSSSSGDGDGKKKSSKLPLIIGILVPIFVIFWVIVCVLVVMQQKKKKAAIAAFTSGNGNGAKNWANGGAPQAGGAANWPSGGAPQAGGAAAGGVIMGEYGRAIVAEERVVDVPQHGTLDQSANVSPSEPLYHGNQE